MSNVVKFMKPTKEQHIQALWDEQEQLIQLSQYIQDRQRHIELELAELQGVWRVQ